ncbi:MAG: 3-phosphoshikimate 1-carboxyvinyltransferase, partial [Deltaproteobacteria bacterium]|nr:3-phosphoshikimate 1-carboxyvinyltransferase [Deltaproteobacteria bacterium]
LILAALSDRPCRVVGPLVCDDSRAMARGLVSLGAQVRIGEGAWAIRPLAIPIAAVNPTLHLGNAGTAVRFVTGLASLLDGSFTIDGDEAMTRRPMPSLLDALRDLGVGVEELGRPGCPPVKLAGSSRSNSSEIPSRVRLRAGGSSQELSALLLAGCRQPDGLEIEVCGELPSMSYVELTLQAMQKFGVTVERPTAGVFRVLNAVPRLAELEVEPDWSSASYPLAASFLTGKQARIVGMVEDSVQGDRVFPEILASLARPGPRAVDLADAPDLAPTVIACALFAKGETSITGAAHLRIKESDRIGVPIRELRKLGADLQERPDGLVVRQAPLNGPAELDPANDHRMAMAFGLVSLRVGGLHVLDPGCVSKSYPDFWTMLEAFR